MKPIVPIPVLLLIAMTWGCSTQESSPDAVTLPSVDEHVPVATTDILEGAERFEIFALHPDPRQSGDLADDQRLGSYEILGRAEISGKSEQLETLALLYRGIRDSDGRVAACFNPRHGIRATRGEDTVEVIICYECLSMQMAHNEETHNVLTSRRVERKITAIWQRHGLKIHGK